MKGALVYQQRKFNFSRHHNMRLMMYVLNVYVLRMYHIRIYSIMYVLNAKHYTSAQSSSFSLACPLFQLQNSFCNTHRHGKHRLNSHRHRITTNRSTPDIHPHTRQPFLTQTPHKRSPLDTFAKIKSGNVKIVCS